MSGFLAFLLALWERLTSSQVTPVEPVKPTVPASVEPVLPVEPEDAPREIDEYGPATAIVRAIRKEGWKVFDDNSKDYNLNIVGERDTSAKLDEFSCKIHAFWKNLDGEWKLLTWDATTYPGSRYLLEHLLNPAGAAILQKGQWPVYSIDTHNGKYQAVCQRRGSVRVFRDGNKDRKFDLHPGTLQTGSFGINIHAPTTPRDGYWQYIASRVYAASAGCQVFKRVADFLEFMALCKKAREQWGNAFTYTLLNDTDIAKADAELSGVLPQPDNFDALEEWSPEGNTVGIRNKNPLNVKDSSDWMYMTGSDDRGHAIFPSFAKGLRAGIITLRTYWTKYNKRTVAGILARWAPATDTIGSLPGAPQNSPQQYSAFVQKRMGFGYNETLSIFNADGSVRNAEQLFSLVHAMAAYENGADFDLPRSVFNEALELV